MRLRLITIASPIILMEVLLKWNKFNLRHRDLDARVARQRIRCTDGSRRSRCSRYAPGPVV
jgi:hypothetical protein